MKNPRKRAPWMPPKDVPKFDSGIRWVYGVYAWRGDNHYRFEDALKIFKRNSDAEKYVKKYDPNSEKNWVVRQVYVPDANPKKPTEKQYRAWLKRQMTGSGPFDSQTSKTIAKTLRKKRVKVGGKWYVVNPTRTGSMPSDFRLRIIRGADGVGGPEKWWIWDSAFRTIRGGPYNTGREARDAFRILKSKGRHSRKVAYGKVKAKKKRANPLGLVKIYAKVTRIEAQKGNTGKFPGEKFFHNFKPPYPSMYGTADRKKLIIKR